MPKKTLPPEFSNEICTICVYTKKNHDFGEKKSFIVSNWRPNSRYFILRHFDFGQNLKKTNKQTNKTKQIPKGIFQ